MFHNIGQKIFRIHFYAFVALTYVPIILLIIFSFNDSHRVGFPLTGFTLEWWKMFFSDASAMGAVQNSFLIASITAVVAIAIGIPAAFALVRHFFRGKNLITSLVVLRLCLPSVVIGVALLLFIRVVLDVELSKFTIILGHLLLAIPYTILILMARLIGFDRSLEEAACDLGANEFTAFRKITLPIIMPGIFTALIVGFIISLEDVVVAHFLSGFETTIPVLVFSLMRRAYGVPLVTAMSAFMVAIVMAGLIVSVILARRAART